MLGKLRLRELSAFFLIFAILLSPINFDIFSLRINDLLIFLSFITLFFINFSIKQYKLLTMLVFLVVILFFSQLMGLVFSSNFRLEGAVFFIKWFILFSAFYVFYFHVVSSYSHNLKIYANVLYAVYMFLSLWVFLYIYLVASVAIHCNFRVSFPLSRDYLYSDAHLYSSLLSMLVFVYFFVIRKVLNHNLFVSIISIFIGVAALVLTGSRGGILMLVIGLLAVLSYHVFVGDFFRARFKVSRFLLGFFTLAFILYLLFTFVSIGDGYSNLVNRAFNFNLSSDQSSLGRVSKFLIAISETSYSNLVFGVGPMSARLDWYDGVIAILLEHGGLLLIVYVFLLVCLFLVYVFRLNTSNYFKFLILTMFFMYLISNLITEYIFITRNFFLVFVAFAITIAFAKSKSLQQI